MASLGSLLDRALAALARRKSQDAERDLREEKRLWPRRIGPLDLLVLVLKRQQLRAKAELRGRSIPSADRPRGD